MPEHFAPELVDTDVLERAHREHGRLPQCVVRVDQPQSTAQFTGRDARLGLVLAVGLVDADDVGEFEDTLLDALQLVTGAGEGEEGERVDHVGDRHLRLPDADRLDEDHVVAGGLEEHHRLAGRLRDAAERARRRGRPNEGVRFHRQVLHPGLVAEDRATGAGRGRVDREDGNFVAQRDQVHPEGFDGRRLADAGHTRDAYADRASGVREQAQQQLLRLLPVIGPGGLDERDRLGHITSPALEDRVTERSQIERRTVSRRQSDRVPTAPTASAADRSPRPRGPCRAGRSPRHRPGTAPRSHPAG